MPTDGDEAARVYAHVRADTQRIAPWLKMRRKDECPGSGAVGARGATIVCACGYEFSGQLVPPHLPKQLVEEWTGKEPDDAD